MQGVACVVAHHEGAGAVDPLPHRHLLLTFGAVRQGLLATGQRPRQQGEHGVVGLADDLIVGAIRQALVGPVGPQNAELQVVHKHRAVDGIQGAEPLPMGRLDLADLPFELGNAALQLLGVVRHRILPFGDGGGRSGCRNLQEGSHHHGTA